MPSSDADIAAAEATPRHPGASLAGGPPPLRLPGICTVCRRWTRGRLCSGCLQRFAAAVPRCVQCGLHAPVGALRCGACLRRGSDAPIDATVAAVDYGFPWDGLIAGFKFHQRLDLGDALARLLATALAAAALPSSVELIVPVPLAAGRLRERGYNQAWELARRVARWRGIAARPDLLLRLKNTAHQLGLSERERAANLRDAFFVEPAQRALLKGRRVALVDDVATSGATADEAARTLKAAGAREVQLWVVARTP
jgi:ComF family protein